MRLPSWLRAALALFAVGWGANQFAALLGVYRSDLTQTQTAGLFGAYAIGLIPALLIAAPISDRRGRRQLVRLAVVVSILASVVLIFARDDFTLVLIGRLLAGVAAGTAFGPGTAWVKELSASAGAASAGARRAAISLTAGFGAGPFIAGIIAQWAPLPELLPYVAHVVVALVVAVLIWLAPETVVRATESSPRRSQVREVILSRTFLAQVVPTAPWVFGAATTALAILPALIGFGGYGTVASGVTAAITLGSGILAQTPARRILRRSRRAALMTGVGILVAGLLLASLTAALHSELLLVPSAILLGGAYGFLLISGLNVIENLTVPEDLGTVTGVFYALTYIGFGFPLLEAALAVSIPPWLILIIAAAVGAIGWITVPIGSRARA